MTCREIEIFFDCGWKEDLPDEVARHLAECQGCSAVYRLLRVDNLELPHVPRLLRQRIVKELTADLHPVAPLTSATRLGFIALGAALVIVLVPTAMMHARALALMTAWQIVWIIGVLGGSAILLAFSLARQHIPGSRHLIAPRPLVVGLLLFLFGTTAWAFPWRHREAFLATGLPCSGIGIMLAVPTAGLLWLVLRRGVALSPRTTAASLGLMAGIAALIALQLNCRIIEAGHIGAWHLSIVLLSTVTGYLLGVFARQRNPPDRA